MNALCENRGNISKPLGVWYPPEDVTAHSITNAVRERDLKESTGERNTVFLCTVCGCTILIIVIFYNMQHLVFHLGLFL